jgi:hypothetical protein
MRLTPLTSNAIKKQRPPIQKVRQETSGIDISPTIAYGQKVVSNMFTEEH